MKNILLFSFIILLPFSVFAQILGQEINCQIAYGHAPDSSILSMYRVHDASVAPIYDTAFVYIEAVINSPLEKKPLPKISQTLLYDNVYAVVYEQVHNTHQFIHFSPNGNYILTQDYINTTDIKNYRDSTVLLTVGGRWYSWYIFAMPQFNTPLLSFYYSGNQLIHDASCTDSVDNDLDYYLVLEDTLHSYPPEITLDFHTGILSIDTTLTGKYLVRIGADNGDRWIIRTMVVDMEKIKAQLATNTQNLVKEGLKITLYPNPASHILNIESEKPINEVILWNMRGQKVHHQQDLNQEKITIDVHNFPQGMYIVRVRQGENWVSEQVLIQ